MINKVLAWKLLGGRIKIVESTNRRSFGVFTPTCQQVSWQIHYTQRLCEIRYEYIDKWKSFRNEKDFPAKIRMWNWHISHKSWFFDCLHCELCSRFICCQSEEIASVYDYLLCTIEESKKQNRRSADFLAHESYRQFLNLLFSRFEC